MKQNIIKASCSALLIIGSMLTACDKDFEKVNTDPIGTPTVTANQLLAPALVDVLSANMLRNRNFNNELMQLTVDISDADGRVFRYSYPRSFSDYLWNAWYIELTNLKDIHTIASKPESLNTSYQGISLITQAWVYSLLTDTYGDVPYSQSNRGKEGIYEAAHDSQKDIYLDLLNKLEEANTLLSQGAPIISTGDPVFKGDVTKWRKLGNSLYLRLLLRISGKQEVASQVIAKIKEIAEDHPERYPLMENNDDTAKILWNGTNSSTTVYSSPFMVSVRPGDFRGVAISSFFIDKLRDWQDPRLDQNLGKNGINRWGIAQGPDGYTGVPSGFRSGLGYTKKSYFYSEEKGSSLQTDPYTGIIMNCAEVKLILAEAAARGWIRKSAENYYNEGIFYSINYWLPNWAAGTSDPAFTQYITGADLGWDENLPLNASTGRSKLELIHIQKYYALFLVDLQQWFEYRRTSHPILPKGDGLANNGIMPARMAYPFITQSANPTNYAKAIAAQGPDEISTQVWWQKP